MKPPIHVDIRASFHMCVCDKRKKFYHIPYKKQTYNLLATKFYWSLIDGVCDLVDTLCEILRSVGNLITRVP